MLGKQTFVLIKIKQKSYFPQGHLKRNYFCCLCKPQQFLLSSYYLTSHRVHNISTPVNTDHREVYNRNLLACSRLFSAQGEVGCLNTHYNNTLLGLSLSSL